MDKENLKYLKNKKTHKKSRLNMELPDKDKSSLVISTSKDFSPNYTFERNEMKVFSQERERGGWDEESDNNQYTSFSKSDRSNKLSIYKFKKRNSYKREYPMEYATAESRLGQCVLITTTVNVKRPLRCGFSRISDRIEKILPKYRTASNKRKLQKLGFSQQKDRKQLDDREINEYGDSEDKSFFGILSHKDGRKNLNHEKSDMSDSIPDRSSLKKSFSQKELLQFSEEKSRKLSSKTKESVLKDYSINKSVFSSLSRKEDKQLEERKPNISAFETDESFLEKKSIDQYSFRALSPEKGRDHFREKKLKKLPSITEGSVLEHYSLNKSSFGSLPRKESHNLLSHEKSNRSDITNKSVYKKSSIDELSFGSLSQQEGLTQLSDRANLEDKSSFAALSQEEKQKQMNYETSNISDFEIEKSVLEKDSIDHDSFRRLSPKKDHNRLREKNLKKLPSITEESVLEDYSIKKSSFGNLSRKEGKHLDDKMSNISDFKTHESFLQKSSIDQYSFRRLLPKKDHNRFRDNNLKKLPSKESVFEHYSINKSSFGSLSRKVDKQLDERKSNTLNLKTDNFVSKKESTDQYSFGNLSQKKDHSRFRERISNKLSLNTEEYAEKDYSINMNPLSNFSREEFDDGKSNTSDFETDESFLEKDSIDQYLFRNASQKKDKNYFREKNLKKLPSIKEETDLNDYLEYENSSGISLRKQGFKQLNDTELNASNSKTDESIVKKTSMDQHSFSSFSNNKNLHEFRRKQTKKLRSITEESASKDNSEDESLFETLPQKEELEQLNDRISDTSDSKIIEFVLKKSSTDELSSSSLSQKEEQTQLDYKKSQKSYSKTDKSVLKKESITNTLNNRLAQINQKKLLRRKTSKKKYFPIVDKHSFNSLSKKKIKHRLNATKSKKSKKLRVISKESVSKDNSEDGTLFDNLLQKNTQKLQLNSGKSSTSDFITNKFVQKKKIDKNLFRTLSHKKSLCRLNKKKTKKLHLITNEIFLKEYSEDECWCCSLSQLKQKQSDDKIWRKSFMESQKSFLKKEPQKNEKNHKRKSKRKHFLMEKTVLNEGSKGKHSFDSFGCKSLIKRMIQSNKKKSKTSFSRCILKKYLLEESSSEEYSTEEACLECESERKAHNQLNEKRLKGTEKPRESKKQPIELQESLERYLKEESAKY